MVGCRRLICNDPVQGHPAAALQAALRPGEHGFAAPSAGTIACRAHDAEMDDPWADPHPARARSPQPGDRREHHMPHCPNPKEESALSDTTASIAQPA